MHKALKEVSVLLLFISFTTMMPMDRLRELFESNVPTIDHRTIPNLFALSGVSLMGYGAVTDSIAVSASGMICVIVWAGTTYANRLLESPRAQNYFPGQEE